MATTQEYKELTKNLGLEDDCPICGTSWPMCQGRCVRHGSWMDNENHIHSGPYHQDFNDDCEECREEEKYPEGSFPP